MAAGLCELNQLRRSLSVTLLTWAARLQDPDTFAALCAKAQMLQQQQQGQGVSVELPSSMPSFLQQQPGASNSLYQQAPSPAFYQQPGASSLYQQPGSNGQSGGVGGGQGAGSMEATLALMQQLEAESASAGV